MKKGVFTTVSEVTEAKRQAWAVRANGLPRLLVEAASKGEAEAKYRSHFHLAAPITWAEMEPCQRQSKTSA